MRLMWNWWLLRVFRRIQVFSKGHWQRVADGEDAEGCCDTRNEIPGWAGIKATAGRYPVNSKKQ